jgi:hypothetical protein
VPAVSSADRIANELGFSDAHVISHDVGTACTRRAVEDPIAVIEMGRAIHDMLPHAPFTEIPDSGHFTPIEQPEHVASAFRAFHATI